MIGLGTIEDSSASYKSFKVLLIYGWGLGKKTVVLPIVVLLCMFVSLSLHPLKRVDAVDGFPVHNLSTGLSYSKIQDAIDANETLDGHTIFVDAGTYDEQLLINKSISLVGESRDATIINWTGNPFLPVVNITGSNVEVTGFSLLSWAFFKIQASQCSNVTIKNNFVESSGRCIYLDSASNCTIVDNSLFARFGLEGNDLVVLDSCSECLIKNNTIYGACYNGLVLINSDNILICNNIISDNGCGITFRNMGSTDREIRVVHNNFMDNHRQINTFWGGSAGNLYGSFEGNYWSDYNGIDVYNGANQNVPGSDNIGDSPYIIDSNNRDNFPLMDPYVPFDNQTIYIRADGSVDPSGAPILRQGDIYALTGNITSDGDGIVIERDSMVIDGAGYTLQGTGAEDSKGIDLSGRTNVTAQNTQIRNFYLGIVLVSSSNNSISGNDIAHNFVGIWSKENTSLLLVETLLARC